MQPRVTDRGSLGNPQPIIMDLNLINVKSFTKAPANAYGPQPDPSCLSNFLQHSKRNNKMWKFSKTSKNVAASNNASSANFDAKNSATATGKMSVN